MALLWGFFKRLYFRGSVSSIIHSLVFSLRGGVGRNQSPVMRPVWLWHTASWASFWGINIKFLFKFSLFQITFVEFTYSRPVQVEHLDECGSFNTSDIDLACYLQPVFESFFHTTSSYFSVTQQRFPVNCNWCRSCKIEKPPPATVVSFSEDSKTQIRQHPFREAMLVVRTEIGKPFGAFQGGGGGFLARLPQEIEGTAYHSPTSCVLYTTYFTYEFLGTWLLTQGGAATPLTPLRECNVLVIIIMWFFSPRSSRLIFMKQSHYVFYEVRNEFLYLIRRSYYLGDPGVDGRIILRWIIRKWDVGVWTRSSWLRIGTVGGHLRMR